MTTPRAAVAVARATSDLDDPFPPFRGVGVERQVWGALGPLERRRLMVRARRAALQVPGVVSHRSAGALWGLPEFDTPDARLHVTDTARTKTHSGRGVVRHVGVLRRDEVVRIEGIAVTSLLRTVVDVIRCTSFRHALVVLDHVLHRSLVDPHAVRAALEPLRGRRGYAVGTAALAFSDPAAESPGESLSRVSVRDLRLPRPRTQRLFRTAEGSFRVDFWWPDHGVVGEFDGRVKYRDRDDVWREKLREDALRRLPEVRSVARWTMREAVDPTLLAPVLLAAGLPVPAARR